MHSKQENWKMEPDKFKCSLQTTIEGIGTMVISSYKKDNHIFVDSAFSYEDGRSCKNIEQDQVMYLLQTVNCGYVFNNLPDLLTSESPNIYTTKESIYRDKNIVIEFDNDNFGFVHVSEYDDETVLVALTTDNLVYNMIYIERLSNRETIIFSFDFEKKILFINSSGLDKIEIPFEFEIRNLININTLPLDFHVPCLLSLHEDQSIFIPKDKWERRHYFNVCISSQSTESSMMTTWRV